MTLRRSPRLSLVIVSLAAAVGLSACGTTVADGEWRSVPRAGSPSAAPSAAPSSAPDTSMAKWTDCKAEIERSIGTSLSGVQVDCGAVRVPQDWANPTGATFDIAMVRVRRTDQKNRIGSLLVNPGGPGASGIELAAQTPLFLPGEIMERFDVVGFDPRGVGKSAPVDCLTAASKDATTAANPDPAPQKEFDEQVKLWRTSINPCVSKYGQSLGYYSTEQTVRDMDAIREAVGDPKMTYLGYSYGTLLGAVYAHLYPGRIRAFVLDGAVDPNLDGITASEGQAAGFEKAFDNFAAACRARGSGCPIGPDARRTLHDVLITVQKKPVAGRGGEKRTATTGHVLSAVTAALYVKAQWPTLEKAIADVSKGDPTTVFALNDSFTGRNADGSYNNMTDAFTAIGCTDDRNPPTVAKVRTLQAEWRRKYPLFGAPLAMTMLSCAVWPGTHDPYPVGAAFGAPPIVVVGTTGDPATPYANTAKLASGLGTGHIVTWQGEGHTAYPQTTCIRENISNYLLTTNPPPDGLTCPAS
ncbi:putative hydrolase or acyltransferase of alpha/beta superfamily [Cryptosporangium arvum DSM 44712]|uniref:Putative hydrolase or acyltransferase of alpha/beta superfamily n=2 Tax=Cryptosporangium TaxID=65502 RepID=A0A010ZUQ0_9ACTN|nr:putative hydrolase or acyltransferase of alpha/beta superfamily [Cryptosporangium arvum DSM 44712]